MVSVLGKVLQSVFAASCEFSNPQTAAGKNQPRQSLIPIFRDELFVYSKVSV